MSYRTDKLVIDTHTDTHGKIHPTYNPEIYHGTYEE